MVKTHMYSITALLFSLLLPFIYAVTYRSFRREKNKKQRDRIKDILKHVLSSDLLFGKKLFVLEEKDPTFLKS